MNNDKCSSSPDFAIYCLYLRSLHFPVHAIANSSSGRAKSERRYSMEYKLLGGSGLKVSALCFGTGTFGGGTEFFKAWGSTGIEEAKRLIGLCQDAGVNTFDTADIYSDGLSEEILGKAIQGKRNELLIST